MSVLVSAARAVSVAILFFLTVVPTVILAEDHEIRKVSVVVPIYREFYNENLGRLLESFGRQRLGNSGIQVELVFVVNNTESVDPGVRTQNIETVSFLQRLAEGQRPAVRPEHADLRRGIDAVLDSNLSIRVLDRTSGVTERNIGRMRNLGVNDVLSRLSPNEMNSTVISHMDGDSVVPQNYVQRMAGVLSANSRTAWGMTDALFYVESGNASTPNIWSNSTSFQLQLAHDMFQQSVNRRLPTSSSPRIFSRASALQAVGGVPERQSGEDTHLVTALREHFGVERGVFLYDTPVLTAYRGRPDGYDASYFLRLAQNRQPLPPQALSNERLLAQHEQNIEQGSGAQFWREDLHRIREDALRVRRVRQEKILERLNAIRRGEQNPTHGAPSAFFTTDWLNEYLRQLLERNENNPQRALEAAIRDFPNILQTPLSQGQDLILRYQAAYRTLRFLQYGRFPNPPRFEQPRPIPVPQRQMTPAQATPARTGGVSNRNPHPPRFEQTRPIPVPQRQMTRATAVRTGGVSNRNPLAIHVEDSTGVVRVLFDRDMQQDSRQQVRFAGENGDMVVRIPHGRSAVVYLRNSDVRILGEGSVAAVSQDSSPVFLRANCPFQELAVGG